MRLSTNAVMLSLVFALGIWGVSPARSAEITVFIKFMTDPANAALLRKGDMEALLR